MINKLFFRQLNSKKVQFLGLSNGDNEAIFESQFKITD